MEQQIITARDHYRDLDRWLAAVGPAKILLVCDGSLGFLTDFNRHLEELEKSGVTFVRFSDFQPNPLYESVVRGVSAFRREACGAIVAVGGGSAMDVAKCIKLYSGSAGDGSAGAWLRQPVAENAIPFLAMPTTAGTGSEATRYAVIYFDGKKQSVTSESFIPATVLLDPSALKTLPPYQKKATMMDALCHGVESFWSVNSTAASREFSAAAIRGVLAHAEGYLANTEEGNSGMLLAAHTAGKAINIAQTTAGHAMCYKLTSLFGVAHGHAAALCDRILFPWMIDHTDRCRDPRGGKFVADVLDEIGRTMGCADAREGARKFAGFFDALKLDVPDATPDQLAELTVSVNPDRLKNHPIALDSESIADLYGKILNGVKR